MSTNKIWIGIRNVVLAVCATVVIYILYMEFIAAPSGTISYQVMCLAPTGMPMLMAKSPDVLYADRTHNGIVVLFRNGNKLDLVNTPCTVLTEVVAPVAPPLPQAP